MIIPDTIFCIFMVHNMLYMLYVYETVFFLTCRNITYIRINYIYNIVSNIFIAT